GQDNALDQERDSAEVPREAERTSDKSSGTESAKSEVTLDDVAEFEMQLEEIAIGERIGLGTALLIYLHEFYLTHIIFSAAVCNDSLMLA
uniref:Uncharacterized protein n=1 Tax=Aegilops tauschii subsp. strangulata TaxID=200361 RepID=A0A453PKI0_AEGTS